MITSKASSFPWRNSWLNLKKKLLIMAEICVLILVLACSGRAFSSDYMALPLSSSAFSPFSELSELFEGILSRFREKGLLKTPQKQRTDSTHILAAIRVLGRD